MSDTADVGLRPVLGVVGLGSMGMGAALSALRRGLQVWGLDLRAQARERFAAEGGHATESLAELAAACDVVQLLVVNAAQTEQLLFGEPGLAGLLRPGSVVIASATVDPALPPQWEARLAERGLPATVRVVEPTGSEIHVVLDFEGRDITAVFRDRQSFRPGDAVHLGLDTDHVHVFDHVTGGRIG